MRWKAFFHLNPHITSESKETFGFNSRKSPPQIHELKKFEREMANMIRNVRFRQQQPCTFQQKLSKDMANITNNPQSMVVPADKTSNFYKIGTADYNRLLQNSITNSYKKIDADATDSINREAKKIATTLDLDDRINGMTQRDAFITLKDHKTNFKENPACRLINPAKSNIGCISKAILDRINCNISKSLNINQWKNTAEVITWFKNIQNRDRAIFIEFDVVNFYPSISAELLQSALKFASNYDNITPEDTDIIMHTKQSVLFNGNTTWGKKGENSHFDVTMGSYDGAETCELIGSFLLHEISKKHSINLGLYRDDGLAVTGSTPRQAEKLKKDLCLIFKKHGLNITAETNKKVTHFLDVTFDLTTGKYSPYNKPNNIPSYIHTQSNHPPCIIKQLPQAINHRLSAISSDANEFNRAAPPYQQALTTSGYTHQLKFTPHETTTPTKQHRRRRKITWFNPPYSRNVANNIGQTFIKILNKSFPSNHPLRKLFNRNNTKIGYSCMPNIKQTINNHNKKLLNNASTHPANNKTCNCRAPNECPLEGNCLSKSLIYQAVVTADDGSKPTESYIGLTENSFKTRFSGHISSFRHQDKQSATELSNYIWQLKGLNTPYTIKWKIVQHARPYDPATKRCNLCISEKYIILTKPEMSSLNKRNELASTCRHSAKYTLQNAIT